MQSSAFLVALVALKLEGCRGSAHSRLDTLSSGLREMIGLYSHSLWVLTSFAPAILTPCRGWGA